MPVSGSTVSNCSKCVSREKTDIVKLFNAISDVAADAYMADLQCGYHYKDCVPPIGEEIDA